MLPWEILPAFSADRLIRVADILRRARDSAAKDAKWNLGDSLWSIGTVAYDRSRHSLTLASMHEYKDWLSVEVADNHFLVKIGLAPMRFYRGHPDVELVPQRIVRVGDGEKGALQLAFETVGMEPREGYMRFEINTNRKGVTETISFVQVDSERNRLNTWPIPRALEREDATPRRGAVKLPPLSLEPPPPPPKPDQAEA